MSNPLPSNWHGTIGPSAAPMPTYTPPIFVCAGCAAETPYGMSARWAVTEIGPLRVCGGHVEWALIRLGYPAPPSPEPEGIPVLKRAAQHYDCEDCWYSCATLTCDDARRSDECDCGASETQAVLDSMISNPAAPPSPEGPEL